MNHMKGVAALLGVRLLEEFILCDDGGHVSREKYRITMRGLEMQEKYDECLKDSDCWWLASAGRLEQMLKGIYSAKKLEE